jgi:peroxin-19
MKQLEADMMASLLGPGGDNSGKGKAPIIPDVGTELPADLEKQFEALSKEFEGQGISMEDVFKTLIDAAGVADEEGAGKSTAGVERAATAAAAAAAATTGGAEEGDTFQDTIQKTLKRMQESGDKATATAAASRPNPVDNPEAVIENLMSLLNSDSDPGDLENMLSSIVHDISNKEMLYEPMKDYNEKYGPWLEENRGKVPPEEFAQYENQARIVREIMEKFDSEGYSDKDPECLAYIWDHMQQVFLPPSLEKIDVPINSTTDGSCRSYSGEHSPQTRVYGRSRGQSAP